MRFSLTKHNLGSLIQKLKELDFTKMWKVEIKEGKHSRSVDQNKYLWHIYRILGDYLGYEPEEIHELLTYRYLREEKEIKNETVIVITRTSTLNTEEFNEYIRQVKFFAYEYGCKLPDMKDVSL
jgi:predicted metallopeptidase